MVKTNISQHIRLYIEISEAKIYLVKDCEVLIVDSRVVELELTPSKRWIFEGTKGFRGGGREHL